MKHILGCLVFGIFASVCGLPLVCQLPAAEAQSTPTLYWSGNVHIRWVETSISGVVYVETEASIPVPGAITELSSEHLCFGKTRLQLSAESSIYATESGFDRVYRALVSAQLAERQVNLWVYAGSGNKCRIERVQIK